MRKQWIRWLPFVAVAAQAVLYFTGVLTLHQAAIVLLVIEGLLATVIVGEALLLIRAYRRAHRGGAGRADALGSALEAVLPAPIAFLVRQELRIFTALVNGLRRRRDVAAGDWVLTYEARLRGVLGIMIGIAAFELAVVEFLVPWTWLRWALLVLGAYGVVWVLGLGASAYTRPHLVDAERLRLRMTIFTDITVPLAGPAVFAPAGINSHERGVEVGDGKLAVSVLGATNMSLTLAEPVEVDCGRLGRHTVRIVRFYVDDPPRAAAHLRSLVRPGAQHQGP